MIKDPALIEHLENIPVESVLSVHGKVNMRAPGSENPNMRTGDIEVHVRSVEPVSYTHLTLPTKA